MDYSKVLVIYCKCGKAYETVGHPDVVSKKEISEAAKNGQKIETISFEDYRSRQTTLGCFGKKDCPNNA